MRLGTIAFLAGIVAGLQFTSLPPMVWSVLLVPSVLILLRFPQLHAIAFFAAGLLWLFIRSSLLISGTLPSELEGKNVIIEGSVVSIPVKRERASQFMFRVDRVLKANEHRLRLNKIKLTWYGDKKTAFKSGQYWRLTVRLKRPNSTMNPGGFDYAAWLLQNHVNAVGYIRDSPTPQLIADSGNINPIYQWRNNLYSQFNEAVSDQTQRGILNALAFGKRDDIPPEQWQRLQDTGTNHLVAISGLHIGLVAAWVYVVVRWFWLRLVSRFVGFPASSVAAIAAFLCAFFYAALAGFALPTQRALIMLMVVSLGVVSRRPLIFSHVWALSLLAVLIYDPFTPLSAGFWLSFAAVGVIIYTLTNRFAMKGLWWKFGRVHVVISIGLAPFLVIFFSQVPVMSPLANLIAVPLVSIITVPLTLLSLVLIHPLPEVSSVIVQIANYSLIVMDNYLNWIHEFPVWRLSAGGVSSTAIVGLIIGTALLIAPRGVPARWLGLFGFIPLLFSQQIRPEYGEYWLSVLDVGQGLAVIVETQQHTLVYDTGARYSSRFDMGDAVVIPYLRYNGLDKVDTVLVSHSDNDHSGGLGSITEAIPVTNILTSRPEEITVDRDIQACRSGNSWQWDGVKFEVLHPPPRLSAESKSNNRNNDSCVLSVTNGVETVLLPGDIERRSEHYLIDRFAEKLNADILLVPHHGSKTSSTIAFIQQVNPEYAVVSAGYRNRWGFPKPEVIKRYLLQGSHVLETKKSGAIKFVLDGDGVIDAPSEFGKENKRFWHFADEG